MQGLDGVVCFLDDILITGKDEGEHMKRLYRVLNTFQETGLKVAKEKCSFFQDRVNYLGYVIDKNGLEASESKILAI